MPSDENLIVISAANMRQLIAGAIAGDDDQRVFLMPADVLRSLRNRQEELRHGCVEAADMTAAVPGAMKSGIFYQPFDRFMSILPTIRALELEDNFAF